MSKRFTDTDKWKKSFIKSLPAEYKLFWLFLLDECDHSGIWHVEMEIAESRLGIKLSLEKIRGLFKEKVVEFDGGNKMFIPDFIGFQYGRLNPSNKAHGSVINNLQKYSLMGLVSPLQGAMDKDKELDKDKHHREKENDVQFPIAHCKTVALNDDRWVSANKTSAAELEQFNELLTKRGHYDKNPMDYKSHFANWKISGKKDSAISENKTPAHMQSSGGPKLKTL